jgi:hypothetical protein
MLQTEKQINNFEKIKRRITFNNSNNILEILLWIKIILDHLILSLRWLRYAVLV